MTTDPLGIGTEENILKSALAQVDTSSLLLGLLLGG